MSPALRSSTLGLLVFACLLRPAPAAVEPAEARPRILALADLAVPPAMAPVEGAPVDGPRRAITFASLPWRGRETRVYAWLGVPENAPRPVPGVVLVHGGGGTAFREWVAKWNERGFAALSIAVEGQTDERVPDAPKGASAWRRHPQGGPARNGIYGDAAEPLEDQFMYHAVGATIRARALLGAQPGVDPARIGVSGISWGGVITATVIGIDPRFAFAIPIYGCGHLHDADNQWGAALGGLRLYREAWDPMVRLDRAKLPVLWLSWPGDTHFPLDCHAASYRAAPGPRMISLIPGLRHGHPPGWNAPDGYAFAESVVRAGRPWGGQVAAREEGGRASVEFRSAHPLERAVLVSTTDRGFTGRRTWQETPATLARNGATWTASAPLPAGTTAWFLNARHGELTLSSEYQERP